MNTTNAIALLANSAIALRSANDKIAALETELAHTQAQLSARTHADRVVKCASALLSIYPNDTLEGLSTTLSGMSEADFLVQEALAQHIGAGAQPPKLANAPDGAASSQASYDEFIQSNLY
ncbi:hypothetical protein EBT31_07610 [bacterium]|nr:hypothetical protein [bacterium]